MNQQLEYLIQLQEIDLRLSILDSEIALMPEEIENHRQSYQKEEEAWEATRMRLDELEKESRKKERELESVEAKLSKYNTQLLSVKTNKEYTAMLNEIQRCKDEKSSLEEDILQLLDHLEGSQTLVRKEEQKVLEKKRLFKEEKSRIEAKLVEAKNDRDVLILKRKGIEKNLKKDLAKEYHKLFEARRGLAIARAKDGSCSGCHLMLMPQLFQEIKIDESKIFRCPNCHRLLFYKKENNEK